jgi:hypothetical protein
MTSTNCWPSAINHCTALTKPTTTCIETQSYDPITLGILSLLARNDAADILNDILELTTVGHHSQPSGLKGCNTIPSAFVGAGLGAGLC